MTADERIEKLLNRYGQTIADLPKPTEEDYAYEEEHRKAAMEAAMKWSRVNYSAGSFLRDYICHLADVIDRMEAALETAARWYPCECCEYGFTDEYWAKTCPCYKGGEYEESGFRIADKLLVDEQEE